MLGLSAIVVAWSALLGTAYVVRRIAKADKTSACVAVVACYLCLRVAALHVLGTGWQGWADAGGMVLPCASALIRVILGS